MTPEGPQGARGGAIFSVFFFILWHELLIFQLVLARMVKPPQKLPTTGVRRGCFFRIRVCVDCETWSGRAVLSERIPSHFFPNRMPAQLD